MSILQRVNLPSDLKKLSLSELKTLASDIRRFLIESVSKTGGHLASNLGVIELTIALHKVFDTPKDKIIWDVGHQSYVHKILTGRKDKFNVLRKFEGLSGFPKTSESEHDIFNTGHSSTSISAALGLARARDIKLENHSVIAVIGDGAMTGGMAFEALNDAGRSENNFIVVLNDNEMSISKNVGGLSSYLSKIRTQPSYNKLKGFLDYSLHKIPIIGNFLAKFVHNLKEALKIFLIPRTIFEELGFTYLGPIDGHNIKKLIEVFKRIKEIKGPILVHIYTTKGKGYKFAEIEPHTYHGAPKFDIEKGIIKLEKGISDYSETASDILLKIAEKNDKIVAITAAMPVSTGFYKFAEKYPKRFFDVGIAEQHAVTLGAGLSKSGLVPVFAVYSSFLQRAYDQLIHDVALQNLHFVFLVDRAGIVGEDGETHQGIYDISYISTMPNFKILAPSDYEDLENMMYFAVNECNCPVAIRYPKGKENKIEHTQKFNGLNGEILKDGDDLTIIAVGNMVSFALEASKKLAESGINAEVINLRSIKPIDKKLILSSIIKTQKVITIEDNIISGGVGSEISMLLLKNNINNVKIKNMGFYDEIVPQGKVSDLYNKYGLNSIGIYNEALKVMKN